MLYRWQKECIESWRKNHYRGIVDVITGAGKTVMAIEGMKILADEQLRLGYKLRVRIVVPTVALARQWKREIDRWGGDMFSSASLYFGTQKDSIDGDVTIYVINSARYAFARHMIRDMENGYHVLMIADECHHYCAAENRKIFSYQTSPLYRRESSFTLGMSATPYHSKYEEILVPSLGKCIYRYHVREAAAEGRISRFAILQVGLSFSAKELNDYGELTEAAGILYKRLLAEYPELKAVKGTALFFPRLKETAAEEDDPESTPQRYLDTLYLRAMVCSMAEARGICCAELIRNISERERVIIFCERIEQADGLYEDLIRENIRGLCRYHSGISFDARKQSLERFRDRETRIMVTVRALDEGLDVPDASIGIVMASSSQERQRIQRLGRVLRPSPGKKMAVLYYLYINEASEDSSYLEIAGDRESGEENAESTETAEPLWSVQTLKFENGSRLFRNDDYEEAAESILMRYMPVMSDDEISEYRKCVERGICAADYLIPDEEIVKMINGSGEQRERNYWMVMRRIGEGIR